jgi:hypothetical protein
VRREEMAERKFTRKQALVAGGIGAAAVGDGAVRPGKGRASADRGVAFEKGGSGV